MKMEGKKGGRKACYEGGLWFFAGPFYADVGKED